MRADRQRLIQGDARALSLRAQEFQGLLSAISTAAASSGTSVVTPYSAIFYATHKCNLDCSYCNQKNPEVFSEELDTGAHDRAVPAHPPRCGHDPDHRRRMSDAAGHRGAGRSGAAGGEVPLDLIVTNGVLLDKRRAVLDHFNGLIVSLDAITHDPSEPMSKSAPVPRVIDNLMMAKQSICRPARSRSVACSSNGISPRPKRFSSSAARTILFSRCSRRRTTASSRTSRSCRTRATALSSTS